MRTPPVRAPDRELRPDQALTLADKTLQDNARLRFRSARARRPAESCPRRGPAPLLPAADLARYLDQAGRTWNCSPQTFGTGRQATSRVSTAQNQGIYARDFAGRRRPLDRHLG